MVAGAVNPRLIGRAPEVVAKIFHTALESVIGLYKIFSFEDTLGIVNDIMALPLLGLWSLTGVMANFRSQAGGSQWMDTGPSAPEFIRVGNLIWTSSLRMRGTILGIVIAKWDISGLMLIFRMLLSLLAGVSLNSIGVLISDT